MTESGGFDMRYGGQVDRWYVADTRRTMARRYRKGALRNEASTDYRMGEEGRDCILGEIAELGGILRRRVQRSSD